MKICHVNFAKDFRGGERQTELLIQSLQAHCEQYLVARSGSPLARRVANMGVPVITYRNPYILRHGYIPKNTLLHAHDARAIKFAMLGRHQYVATRRILKTPSSNRLTRMGYRRAAQVICVSTAISQVMQGWDQGISVKVVHDAHANLTANLAEVQQLRQLWPHQFIVGHVGALVDGDKGQMLLLEAAAILRHQLGLDVAIVLVGKGDDESLFKTYAKEQNIPLYCAGHVDNVADYMRTFDCFAFPSRQEGFGSSVLDALHQGRVVVVSDVGGLPEIVTHGQDGYITPYGRADLLAKQLEEILTNMAGLESVRWAAQQTAQRFSASHMATQYLELYHQVKEASK